MILKNLPDDLNIEVLLNYLKDGSCKVAMAGPHKRNAYKDILDTQDLDDETMLVRLGRISIYNSLPEFLFHSIDRFDHLDPRRKMAQFDEEYNNQEAERDEAYRFFEPFDLYILQLRQRVRRYMDQFTQADNDVVMQQILGDRIAPQLKANRFVRQVLPLLPQCRNIRGDRTLITMLLRKVFLEEGIHLERQTDVQTFTDPQPRYPSVVGAPLLNTYVGNVYDESVYAYTLTFWPQDDCDDKFMDFIADIEPFRQFFQDYFLGLDEVLRFDIRDDDAPALHLTDTTIYNYLGYNTNL